MKTGCPICDDEGSWVPNPKHRGAEHVDTAILLRGLDRELVAAEKKIWSALWDAQNGERVRDNNGNTDVRATAVRAEMAIHEAIVYYDEVKRQIDNMKLK